MLPFVLHLLGDLLEIGSRSCELRRLSVLQQDFQGPQRAPFLRTSSTLQMLCIDQVSSICEMVGFRWSLAFYLRVIRRASSLYIRQAIAAAVVRSVRGLLRERVRIGSERCQGLFGRCDHHRREEPARPG